MNYEVMASRIILEGTQTAAERDPHRKPRGLGGARRGARNGSGVFGCIAFSRDIGKTVAFQSIRGKGRKAEPEDRCPSTCLGSCQTEVVAALLLYAIIGK